MEQHDFLQDEDLQIKLFKRIRKRELCHVMMTVCVLMLLSYVGAYCANYAAIAILKLTGAEYSFIATSIADILIYCAQLLLPVAVYFAMTRKRLSEVWNVGLISDDDENEGVSFAGTALYFVIAFSMSQIMSYFSSFFVSFMSGLLSGISGDLALDPGAYVIDTAVDMREFISGLILMAVLPAILEELLFRGVLLSCFMKYGKTFAITASAFFFASVHGSIQQMVYSFVFGIIFGYIAVKTGSLTTGVIIHFLNNAYSCLVDYLGNVYDTDLFWNIVTVVNFTLILIGIVCIVILVQRNGFSYPERTDEDKSSGELTGAESFSVFVSPVMLLYYGLILFETFYIYFSYNM